MKIHIWDYNDKFYLKTNDLKVRELPCEIEFEKYVPYFVDLTVSKYDFEKKGEHITGYSISEIDKIYSILIYREMGLSESSLNLFSF